MLQLVAFTSAYLRLVANASRCSHSRYGRYTVQDLHFETSKTTIIILVFSFVDVDVSTEEPVYTEKMRKTGQARRI
jgi:hypothetical protein